MYRILFANVRSGFQIQIVGTPDSSTETLSEHFSRAGPLIDG
jgi:hypothetical protein